jgi:site-specific recombinase XerD
VVGLDGLPLWDAEVFLNYLRTVRASPNTVRTYARHLALLFRWLHLRGAWWETLDFETLCLFVQDLGDGTVPVRRPAAERIPRRRAAVEGVLSAVISFLTYWRAERRGPQDLRLYEDARMSMKSTHAFLAHIEQQRQARKRRIQVRGEKAPPPRTISFEDDFRKLLAAARTLRDRTLLSALYDGGLRIGQALGLRHEDLNIARKQLSVVRREDNANGALSKQPATFTIDIHPRFFELYGTYLVDEQLAAGIDSDYVFVNLDQRFLGRPMSYANAVQVVQRIGARAGIQLTPHTLRHTHGTMLARQDWTAPQIAKRLGQSHPSSADVYIHLVEDDISEKFLATHGRRHAQT